MAARKKKTILRTFRITADHDTLLEMDAKAKNVSVNTLVNSIITRYAEWDRFTEKFGFISLSNEAFRRILETTDERKLVDAARELGGLLTKDSLMFWFKRVSLETFLDSISLFCKYGGLAKYDLQTDGRNYAMTARHDLGQKWSDFLKEFMEQGTKAALGINARFETGKSSLTMKFTAGWAIN